MTSHALAAVAALVLSQQPATPPPTDAPAPPATTAPAAPAPVTVELVGFQSPRGTVRLALYRSEDGFPTDFTKAVRKFSAPVTGDRVVMTLDGLEPGTWAIAAYHDENDNNELDTNFIGIPKEGLGVSNDPKGSFGPPDFEDARFELDGKPRRMRITMQYL